MFWWRQQGFSICNASKNFSPRWLVFKKNVILFFWRLPNALASQNPSKKHDTHHSLSQLCFLTQAILSSQKNNPRMKLTVARHFFLQPCSITTYCKLHVHAVLTEATDIHHKNDQNQEAEKGERSQCSKLGGVQLQNQWFCDGVHWPQSHPNPSLQSSDFWQDVVSESVPLNDCWSNHSL